MRLDAYLAGQGLCRSRSRAAALIKNHLVYVDGKEVVKPSFNVTEEMNVTLLGDMEFVGRGGEKLRKAVEVFNISLKDKTCVDIGASTGGFTDCMLKNGASKVFAVDVGSGQLDPSLAADPRVVNMENTNIRFLDAASLGKIDFAAADVSFISLRHVFPVLADIVGENGSAVCLVKPQFEAGREHIGKNGIVKDKRVQERVLRDIIAEAEKNGLYTLNLASSPIKGGDGNTEYLIYLSASAPERVTYDIINTVKGA